LEKGAEAASLELNQDCRSIDPHQQPTKPLGSAAYELNHRLRARRKADSQVKNSAEKKWRNIADEAKILQGC